MKKHGWVERKRRGKDPNSPYFDRYAIGSDLYRDGRKVGAVSPYTKKMWFPRAGEWRGKTEWTEYAAKAAVCAHLGWSP